MSKNQNNFTHKTSFKQAIIHHYKDLSGKPIHEQFQVFRGNKGSRSDNFYSSDKGFITKKDRDGNYIQVSPLKLAVVRDFYYGFNLPYQDYILSHEELNNLVIDGHITLEECKTFKEDKRYFTNEEQMFTELSPVVTLKNIKKLNIPK